MSELKKLFTGESPYATAVRALLLGASAALVSGTIVAPTRWMLLASIVLAVLGGAVQAGQTNLTSRTEGDK